MEELLEKQKETTLRDFLNVIFRRKFLIVAVVLLATAVVVILTTRQPTIYQSEARMLVKRGEVGNVFTGSVRYLPWEEEMSSQIEVILSETIFSRAREILADSVRARGLPGPVGFHGGAVRADVVGGSNVLVVSYTDPDPLIAQLGCAAVAEAYREYYKVKTQPPALADFFAAQIGDVKAELDYWRKKRRDFLSDKEFLDVGEESRFLLNKLSSLELKLTEVKNKLSEQEMKVRGLESMLKLPPEELEEKLSFAPSQNLLMHSGIISTIKYQLQNARLTREKLMARYTEKHPEVIAVDGQIGDLLLKLKMEVENYYRVEQTRFAELEAERKALENEIAASRRMLSTLPDKQMELARMDNTIGMLEDKYKLLLQKQNEAEIVVASSPEWEVTILSSASRAYPKKTRDYIRMALGPFFSLIVAIGLAFFFESLDHSLRNAAEVEEYLGLPVLATVTEIEEGD